MAIDFSKRDERGALVVPEKQVDEFVQQEINHHVDVIVGAEEVEPMIVKAIAGKIKKSLDPVIKHHKDEYTYMTNELNILRRSKEQTESKLNEAYVKVEKMEDQISLMQDNLDAIVSQAKEIKKVGEFANSLKDTIVQMVAMDATPKQEETL